MFAALALSLAVFFGAGTAPQAPIDADALAKVPLEGTDIEPKFVHIQRAEVALEGLITLGDVGYQDDDGYLYLCDRVRDMVVSGGVNIYPAEVEGALFALDGVSDCAVIGVPDAEYGEAVVALVSGTGLDPQVLRAQLKDRIAGYKVPREIVIVSALERDASGKLRKGVLRDRFLAGWRG